MRLLIALGSLALLAGCAGGADEDEPASEDEISASQAAEQLGFKKEVLRRHPASADVKALGVESWTVWGIRDNKIAGSVLFAVDKRGEVKFAILVNAQGKIATNSPGRADQAELAVLEFDAEGPSKGAVSQRTAEVLFKDFPSIAATLKSQRDALRNDCAMGVAAIAVGLVAVGLTTWLILPLLALEAGASVTLLMAGRAVAAVPISLFSIAAGPDSFVETFKACKTAAQ